MHNYVDIILTTFEPTFPKIAISLVLLFGFLFGDLYTQGIVAVLMLVLFDTVLGVMATVDEGQAITSRKFARLIYKCTVYLIAISAGYFADVTIGIFLIQAIMIGFIGVTEFISILENMGRLGFQTPKKLLNQLRDFQSNK